MSSSSDHYLKIKSKSSYMTEQIQIEKSWSQFLNALESSLDSSEVEAWVKELKLIHFESDLIQLGGLNQFFCNFIRDHHVSLLKSLLLQFFKNEGLKESFQLELKIASKTEQPTLEIDKQNRNGTFNDGLDAKNQFEFFVNGSNSNIAYAAAQAVADNLDNQKYNPLFLCGDVGLGKTHLMQAIGLQIREKNRNKKILYSTSSNFTEDVVNGIRFGSIQEVKRKYRSLDLLLIDDIQFLENKQSTQEEFFHTFNELIQSGKQIVITSDRYPREIKNIEERLTSRFSAGMVARIEPPDFETKVAIIQNEIDRMQIKIDDEIVSHIAHAVKSNVRDLKGVLIRLEAEWSLMSQEITMDNTRLVLKEVLNLDDAPKSIDEMIRLVAKKFNVKAADILSEKRDREISNARQTAMYIAKEITDFSYPVLGRHFGGKNHTSVMQACKKTKHRMEEDAELKQIVNGIIRELLF